MPTPEPNETPRDQPSNVATEDVPRAPDKAVVTTDTPSEPPLDAADDKDTPGTAAAAKSPEPEPEPGPNDRTPAPDDKTQKQIAQRPRRDRSSERKIRTLNRKIGEHESNDQANKARIAALEEQVASIIKGDSPEPLLENFKTPQEYAKEYAKWGADNHTPPPPRTPTPQTVSPAPTPTHQPDAVDPEVDDFLDKGASKLGDEFIEATKEKTAVNQLMAEYMMDSDVGPEIYVHLANNPEEARKIYDASQPRQSKALEALAAKATKGELDVGDGGMKKADPEPDPDLKKGKGTPPTRQTKAPSPPSDTQGGNSVPEGGLDDLGMDEYAARRRRDIARSEGRNTY